MKYILFLATLVFVLAGCTAMEEAYYTDREFGAATNDAFDRQIVHKDYAYADKTVEGLPALHAESVMETYHQTFSEGFTSQDIDTVEVGSESN